jgi:hypothetical protein
MPGKSTLTGNLVVLKIRGVEIGRAQSITADSDFGLEDVSGIGNVEIQEHVNTKITHTLTIDKFIINKRTLLEMGFVPVSEDVLQMGVIDIEILTKDTGTLIKKYESCSCASYSLRVNAHAIVGENATWRSLSAAVEGSV